MFHSKLQQVGSNNIFTFYRQEAVQMRLLHSKFQAPAGSAPAHEVPSLRSLP